MRSSALLSSERVADVSGVLVMLVIAILSVYMVYDASPRWIIVAGLFLAQFLLFLLFLSGWGFNSRFRQELLMWLQAAVAVALYFLVDISFIAILGIIWIVQAVEVWGSRKATLLMFASISLFTVSQLYHWYDTQLLSAIVSSISLGIFQVFALAATQRAVRERLLREKTAELNRELITTRDLLSQSARQSERLRIARNLHDLLGHHMTALILNLEVANHCSEGKAKDKVEQSLALGKLLLSDIRTAVSELRDDELINLRQSIEKLIAQIPGLTFELDIASNIQINNLETAETLLRCVQEAITNVLRHSNASRCLIRIHTELGKLQLSVTDNGGIDSPLTPGNGLKGMSERVQQAGGKISWQHDGKGFDLKVSLPAGISP